MAYTKQLVVEVLGRPVGLLAPAEPPKHVFTYFPDTPATHFVSLSMPVRLESYVWIEGLHPVFQMNLPEGYQKDILRSKLGSAMPVDDFNLLALTGNRGIGRFSVHLLDTLSSQESALPRAAILAHADSRQALLDALNELELENISGVMPKVIASDVAPLLLEPDQKITVRSHDWILKTGRQDTPGIAINEYLCLTLAREMGLPVPEIELSKDGNVLAVRRFDREEDGTRLGLEDFCALMGMPPYGKYEATMEGIAKHLNIWCAESERVSSAKRLIEMLVLNLVVRNADAHAKNYAILYSSTKDATLAPVFDVVTVGAYPSFANAPFGMSIGGRKAWGLRKELERFCVERLNLPAATVTDSLEKAAVGMDKLMPLIGDCANEFQQFRETGKRMVKLWQEGIAVTSGLKATSVDVNFSAPHLSEAKKPKKQRKSKKTMNPEKLG